MRGILLWIIAGVVLYAEGIKGFIDARLKALGLSPQEVSVIIAPLQDSGVGYRLHDKRVRVPASVMKIPTVYANLRYFGLNYRIPTKFYALQMPDANGKIDDLYIRGYGDPSLSEGDLGSIVRSLKQAGIKRIEGDIVIDRSFFQTTTQNSARFDQNPYSPYNAMPDAMMFNARISTLCIDPKAKRAYDLIGDESYQVIDRITYVNKPCRGVYAWPRVRISEEGGESVVYLEGKLSTHCPVRKVCKVLTKPFLSFFYALEGALEEGGIVFEGELRLQKVPPHARLLFIHRGDKTSKIFARTLKKSDNLYARQLMLLLGAMDGGRPATLAKGRDAIQTQLRLSGIFVDDRTFFVDNGSGLSRRAKITAKTLEAILRDAYGRYGKKWLELLSVAGVDGTIKRRFRHSKAHKRAWMKTGTLKHVKNIAGYVQDRAGRYYIVVILVNSRKGNWRGAQLQNDIINELSTY